MGAVIKTVQIIIYRHKRTPREARAVKGRHRAHPYDDRGRRGRPDPVDRHIPLRRDQVEGTDIKQKPKVPHRRIRDCTERGLVLLSYQPLPSVPLRHECHALTIMPSAPM